MNIKVEVKDIIINSKVNKSDKKLIDRFCKKKDVTQSHLIRIAVLKLIANES